MENVKQKRTFLRPQLSPPLALVPPPESPVYGPPATKEIKSSLCAQNSSLMPYGMYDNIHYSQAYTSIIDCPLYCQALPSKSTHLLIFAVSFLCNVFGLLQLHLLDLHLLLVLHGPVLNHLHTSGKTQSSHFNKQGVI